MSEMNPLVQIVVSIAGVVVSAGIPLFIFQFSAFKKTMEQMRTELKIEIDKVGQRLDVQNEKIDKHIANYDIHFKH